MGEVVVEAADHVEDKSAVGDDFAEGPKVVSHLLESTTVLRDGEVALDEVAELRLELDGTGLLVAEELGLDGKPCISGGGALGGDDFGECAENPGLHHAVHPNPVRGEDWCVEVDVILERELAEGQQKLIAPATELTGVDVKDDRDEAADVVDSNRLGEQVQEGSGFLKEHGGVQIRWCSVRTRGAGGS